MSKEKQIEEMAKIIYDADILCDTCGDGTGSYCSDAIASLLYNAGYRKQSEGEWVHTDKAQHWHGQDECSECGFHDKKRNDLSHLNFCPNCGAKMKGGL